MNDVNTQPKTKYDASLIINYQFTDSRMLIFWGPDQYIKENDVYVPPQNWNKSVPLTVPKVVRFISDAHEYDESGDSGCNPGGPPPPPPPPNPWIFVGVIAFDYVSYAGCGCCGDELVGYGHYDPNWPFLLLPLCRYYHHTWKYKYIYSPDGWYYQDFDIPGFNPNTDCGPTLCR